MIGGSVVVDTSVAIEFLNSEHAAISSLKKFRLPALCSIVYGGLIFGALNPNPYYQNEIAVKRLLGQWQWFTIDANIAEEYAFIRHELKGKGKPIPENDMWIAATARRHNLPLLTLDAHFLPIDRLQVVRP